MTPSKELNKQLNVAKTTDEAINVVQKHYNGKNIPITTEFLEKLKSRYSSSSSSSGGGLSGTNYVFVQGNGTPQENGEELIAAYNTAKTMNPAEDNRITVIVASGNYMFPFGGLVMDTDYIDLVSLTGNRDVILYLDNSENDIVNPSTWGVNHAINITAEIAYVKGLKGGFQKDEGFEDFWNVSDHWQNTIQVGENLPMVTIENCEGGPGSFSGTDILFDQGKIAASTYINCENNFISDNFYFGESFGGDGGEALGTFINCKSGFSSFGQNADASGYFEGCSSENNAFGNRSDASGTFIKCAAKGDAFGSGGTLGSASGVFIDCEITEFGAGFGNVVNSNTTGHFIRCRSIHTSFNSRAAAIYENCFSGSSSFGTGTGIGSGDNSGKFYYCRTTGNLPTNLTGDAVIIASIANDVFIDYRDAN